MIFIDIWHIHLFVTGLSLQALYCLLRSSPFIVSFYVAAVLAELRWGKAGIGTELLSEVALGRETQIRADILDRCVIRQQEILGPVQLGPKDILADVGMDAVVKVLRMILCQLVEINNGKAFGGSMRITLRPSFIKRFRKAS